MDLLHNWGKKLRNFLAAQATLQLLFPTECPAIQTANNPLRC